MNRRALGDTGIEVGEIGLGCGGLGVAGKEDLDHVLEFAFDCGVTFYDTAETYADGQSERILGRVFENRRDRVVFATKFRVPKNDAGGHDRAASLAHLREAVDASLRRLRTDWIDVYQLHNPPMSVLDDDELIGTLDALKRQGKIRCYGPSIDVGEDAVRFLDRTDSQLVQMILNLFQQAARGAADGGQPTEDGGPGFLGQARRRDAGVIVKVPMAGGTLTGRFGTDYPPPDDERRQRWGEADFQRRLELVERVRPILEQPGRTMAQGALAWLLSLKGVSVLLPGITSLDKTRECIEAAGMRLSDQEMAELDHLDDGLLRRLNLPW